MVMIYNSSLFCLYIFVLEDLAFFPTVSSYANCCKKISQNEFEKLSEQSIVFKDYFMIRKSDMTNKSFAGNIDMTTKVLFPVILQTLKHSQP